MNEVDYKKFHQKFYELHNEFVNIIRTDYEEEYPELKAKIFKYNDVIDVLYRIGSFILEEFDSVQSLSMEDLCYVINFVKLGKQMHITSLVAVAILEEYQIIESHFVVEYRKRTL